MKPAIFLDRDGTIIEHVHHLNNVDDVHLIPGAATAIAELRRAGYLCVVVTNQSVVGRGMLDIDGLERIHARMNHQLAGFGAQLDGVYYCCEVPRVSDQAVVEYFHRKPGPGMLLQAADELDIDLSHSWMIGDSLSDLYAGKNAGCLEALLVLTGFGKKMYAGEGRRFRAFPSLKEAAAAILAETTPETYSSESGD